MSHSSAAAQSPIRVFIADDHEVVRRGIRELLTDAGMEVVGEARHGWEVLNATSVDRWDVLLLDLSLPKISGPEVLKRLRERRPSLKVVVLSMYPPSQYAPALLAAGAYAYLSKDEPGDAIVETIRAASAGLPAPGGLPAPAPGARPPHLELSSREHQVFTLILHGRAVGDIAAELDVRSSTVSTHLAKIREKLGVRTVGEILNYAYHAGLIDRPSLGDVQLDADFEVSDAESKAS